jgi:hypothetical protein
MPAVLAAGIDDTGKPLNLLQVRPARPVQLEKRPPTLEEMIERSPMPAQYNQPIPLRGVNISGLHPKSVEALGFSYFIVVDNTKFLRMSDVYRESRLNGKSNFVTADSITHPYLAFANRVLADAAVTRISPDLRAMLEAMQRVSIADYRAADDVDVRNDIEHNVAYLAVAMRLLDPSYEMPRIGMVPEMVDEELQHIFEGKLAQSAIFDGEQDFSVFNPTGWYNDTRELQNFYRCRQWLSCVPFAVNDSTSSGTTHSNMFRRSVLLFRAIDQADVLGKPALETWTRLVRAFGVYGAPIESWHERTLYPKDYKFVFQDQAADLKVTLQALAEPLFRTKLMLAVRRQKPNALNSTSIFDIADLDASNSRGVFRLLPMFGEPELPWLRGVAAFYPADKQAAGSWPVGLLDMYAWGSQQAGNILADNMWTLDPNLAHVLPDLQKCVVRRAPNGQLQPVDSRAWRILSQFFKPLPEGVPGVLRSELWHSRRVMSAIGGWVDAVSSIAPAAADTPAANAGAANAAAGTMEALAASNGQTAENNTSESMGPVSAAVDSSAPRRISKVPPYHFLDPSLEIYRQLEADALRLQSELDSGNYFPAKYKTRLEDFVRLFQRLQKIADAELRGRQITVIDRRLLANIDTILDKVDTPLPAVLGFEAQPRGKSKQPGDAAIDRGFNMAIGRPGMLYIIYQNPRTMEWTLGRGAVYTYYEMAAPLLTASMWQHKLDAGFAHPPQWAQKWEIVQKPKNATQALLEPMN